MLAKRYKLPIDEFIKRKPVKSYRFDFFGAKIGINNFPYSRFGFVISKKTAKKATQRNLIKRIIFSEIQKNKLHLQPGKDILIIANPKIVNLSKEEIKTEIQKELKQF